MLIKPFGTAWTYEYKPQVGGETVVPTGSPAIYFFSQTRPTEAQARSGSGAVSSLTSWTYDDVKQSATFTVPAVNDPQDGTRSRIYWVAINFTITGGSQAQCDIRSYTLAVPDGEDQNPTPSVELIFSSYDSTLDGEKEPGDIELFIARAERDVKRDLKWQGFGWPRVESLDDLKEAIIWKTLVGVYHDLNKTAGDVWEVKRKLAEENYSKFSSAIKIIYDKNDDQQIDEGEKNEEGIKYTRFIR